MVMVVDEISNYPIQYKEENRDFHQFTGTTEVEKGFFGRWLANSEVIGKYYSPPNRQPNRQSRESRI